VIGRPQLIGTTSVEHSERLSARLGADAIRRLMRFFLIRDHYLESKNIEITERAIPELQPLITRRWKRSKPANLRQLPANWIFKYHSIQKTMPILTG
jgi:hypothetical protein